MDRTEDHADSALQQPVATASAHVFIAFGDPLGVVRRIADDGLVIGRAPAEDAAILAVADSRVSRRHVTITRDTLGWKLVDLGSRNGGFVDGAPFGSAESVPLDDGAMIRLGNSLFVFRACEPSQDVDLERDSFPGVSPPAANVRKRLGLLASSSGHVLVLGETGTGKERVARRLGRTSPGRPFVPLNCAETTRDLVRSELFGHVRGAFSGAAVAKPGLIETAQDGTLFLDEIGELPLEVQADLLRFLEDGSYRPVGASELRHSRARVVAATNVDLDEAVRSGAFRRDLLARLRAANRPLVLPPLRERREDILGWARLFLDEAVVAEPPDEIWTAGAAECLLLYPWPENLRELRGVIRSLVESPPAWPIDSRALPEAIQACRRALRVDREPAASDAEPAELSREAIEQALRDTGGRMRTTAQLLGIDRRKLYRMCEKLGIAIETFRGGGD